MTVRDWLHVGSSPDVDLEAENAALPAQLAARDQLNKLYCRDYNRLEVRVATLSKRTCRLLRLAKYWRAPGRKPMSDREKAIMMVRYVELGGLERGKGIGAVEQITREFGLSPATIHRCISEFKDRSVTKAEAHKVIENYRRRYGG